MTLSSEVLLTYQHDPLPGLPADMVAPPVDQLMADTPDPCIRHGEAAPHCVKIECSATQQSPILLHSGLKAAFPAKKSYQRSVK